MTEHYTGVLWEYDEMLQSNRDWKDIPARREAGTTEQLAGKTEQQLIV